MGSAREAALFVLERCRRDGAWSGLVLDQLLQNDTLDARDAALAVQLSLGVIQNDRYLDYYIDHYCHASGLEPKLRDILRLGAYQILLLDKIPAHAAVDESVSLCRRIGLSRACGLVNAVLRRLSEHRNDLPEIPGKGSSAYLAVRYSQSDWLAEELTAQRGYAFTEDFFRACQQPATLDLQINTLKTDFLIYSQKLEQAEKPYDVPAFPSRCVSLRGGKPNDLPGYDNGLFYVQDRAAASAVEIASPQPGMKVLDACAAPGGKSFAAAIRMEDKGEIISCDLHEKKLRLIENGAKRLGITCIRTMPADAMQENAQWLDSFDLVIADVPCSGFGVMRKKPEIRARGREDAARLPEIQARILDNLSCYVKPGGTLLYSTCTVLRQENEEIMKSFLRKHADYHPADFSVGERASENGCYTFWPQIDGTDGFFVSKLIRGTK